MSVTESKTKTERKSSRKPAKTQETVLSALLEQTEEVSVSLASLIKSPLNVRTVPYSAESVSELAESIKGVGLLQNLVVHALPGDRHGVAAGGRRLAALNMLAERGILPADWPVRVKVIPQELATAASMTETAIGFHMRDWWQPTKANFFGHLKKPQIIAALNDAGLSGAARDAEKMKKGDAAEHAEHHMKDNRWVPGWMCAPHPQTDTTERTDNLADAA
ncbi:TPA: ParB/Srx family N-terminal domain-containing protein [Escherichia coli]